MEFVAGLSDRVQEPAYHVSVSWSKDDDPSKDDMLEVADRVLARLGLENNQALIVSHKDTDHPHIHIGINRVEMEQFKAVDRWKDRDKVRDLLMELETEKGWDRTPEVSTRPQSLTKDEQAVTIRVNEALAGIGYDNPAYQTVRQRALILREQLSRQPDWTSFDNTLARKGLWAEKKGAGMVVTDGAMSIKASSLGKSFSKGALEHTFGQSFDAYVTRRELTINVDAAMKEVTDWTRARERITLEKAKAGAEKTLQLIKSQSWKIERYDQLLARQKEAIDQGFERTFSDPKDAMRDFAISVERDGLEEAHADLLANPRTYGRVRDVHELPELSTSIRKLEETYDKWSQFLVEKLLKDPKARKDKLKNLEKNKDRLLRTGLPSIRGALYRMTNETEAGYSINRAATEVIAVSRVISAITKNSEVIAKKSAGYGLAVFKRSAMKESEAGRAVVQMTDQSVKAARTIVKIASMLHSGGISVVNSGIRHSIHQHWQAAVQKQLMREANRGDFSR